jgi:uncharacterized protein YceK
MQTVRIVLIFKVAILLVGCGNDGIKVECCRGLPASKAPMTQFDKRWNTRYYYSPVFDEYNKDDFYRVEATQDLNK